MGLGFPEPEDNSRLLAVGMPLPDKEVAIFDEYDQEVSTGEVGEIVIRGGFMLGYLGRPEKTAQTLRGGWLHTGDMGKMDADGYVYMLGRWAERIVSFGKVIFPRGLEEALYRHLAVHQACVIGKPDPQAGELPKAIVTLYEGKIASPEELLAHCRSVLGEGNVPAFVEIIPEMPMTPTGKIGRADLQAREKELAS